MHKTAYEMRISDWSSDVCSSDLPAAFFDRLGMTRTFAEHDKNGDYILSSQVWTSARDLARLGLLYQNDGMWRGERLLPADWRRFVTTPSGPQPGGAFGYGAGFWLLAQSEGVPANAFGDRKSTRLN